MWISANLLRAPKSIFFLNKLIKIFLPLGAAIFCVSQWFNLPQLCEFLNQWPKFFVEFDKAFSSYYNIKFDLTMRRNVLLIIWLVPLFAILFVSYPVNVVYGNALIGRLMGYLSVGVIIGARDLFYVKDFLLLETLRVAYEQVWAKIFMFYRFENSFENKIINQLVWF